MTKYVAVAQIEKVVKGERVYVDPGQIVTGLSEKDVLLLKKNKAIRELTAQEQELEGLRAKSSATVEDPDAKNPDAKDGDEDEVDSGEKNEDGTPKKVSRRRAAATPDSGI